MSADGEYEISIRKIKGEMRVGVEGFEHIKDREQRDEIREIVEQYGDYLIELKNIRENHSGLDEKWHMGRVISNVDDEVTLAELARHCTFDIGANYNLTRNENFYSLFPEQNYDESFGVSLYDELCTNKRVEKGAKEAYDRLQEHDIEPSVWAIRAWGSLEDYDDLENIIKTIYKKGRSQTTQLDSDVNKVAEGVRVIQIMAGNGMEIHKEEIREMMESIDFNSL